MLDRSNLAGGNINVAGLRAGIKIQTGDLSQGLTPLMANGEAILQNSQICRKCRQGQQQTNACNEFSTQVQST